MTVRTSPLVLLAVLSSFTAACGGSDSPSVDPNTDVAEPSGDGDISSGDGDGDMTGVDGDGDGDGDMTGSGGNGPTLEPPNWEVTGITTWRNDATAAYTIVHDDICNSGLDNLFDIADPALRERGLVATFGAIAYDCLDRDLWSELDDMIAHGHEIANHSYDHPFLTQPSTDVERQIDFAHEIFAENLTDYAPTFFIFPFDSFNDSLIERLRDLDYLGARAGDRGFNSADFADDLRINFDVFGPGYSIYVGREGTPCEGVESLDDWETTSLECRTYIMNQYVDDLIDRGGYGIRELHSVEGEAWEPIPESEYEAHLDFVVEKIDAGDLWMATGSDAVRYRRGREACLDATISADTITVEMTEACERFATVLTYEITHIEGNATSIVATQGGEALEAAALGDGSFQVNVDPSLGAFELNVQ